MSVLCARPSPREIFFLTPSGLIVKLLLILRVRSLLFGWLARWLVGWLTVEKLLSIHCVLVTEK